MGLVHLSCLVLELFLGCEDVVILLLLWSFTHIEVSKVLEDRNLLALSLLRNCLRLGLQEMDSVTLAF
jgi:hypothetical protein